MLRIQLHPIKEQNDSLRTDMDAAIARVLDSGQFIGGREVARFEKDFAAQLGVQHCIGVGNATDGFEIAFRALGLERGDEVIVPANAHVSPALAAMNMGSVPVFCDVDEDRMLINAETATAQITERTRAIVAVHLYGRVCPMDELTALCREKGLLLIEDLSQAHGASSKGRKVGSFGDAGVCSFYPTKPLGALGDGGAILTSDTSLADTCRTLANYGWKERDNASMHGRNSRLDELQAALLHVKLPYLDQWNTERVLKANALQQGLNGVEGITVPEFGAGDVCHLFVIRSGNRDELREYLQKNGVDCQVHYPIPIHRQKAFSLKDPLSVAENLCLSVLSLPVDMRVASLVEKFNAGSRSGD